MAFKRPIRLVSAKHTTSTTIDGAVEFSYGFTAAYVSGGSDGAVGDTACGVTGWTGRGHLILDQYLDALALSVLASTDLVIVYKAQDSATGVIANRTQTFDAVNFGDVERFEVPRRKADGNTARFRVPFDIVFATADDTPDDAYTFS
jgi:hypothetical protein